MRIIKYISKANFKLPINSRNPKEKTPIYISTNRSLGVLNVKDENRRYHHLNKNEQETPFSNSLERESNNIQLSLNDSDITKDKMNRNKLFKKNTLPLNNLLDSYLSPLNMKHSPLNSKEKVGSIYSSVNGNSKSPSLPLLNSKIYKFKTRKIKANDKTIGDANLIKQRKENELEHNNILVFDMETKGETGFDLRKSPSPSINEMINKSFTPYISKINSEDRYKTRK